MPDTNGTDRPYEQVTTPEGDTPTPPANALPTPAASGDGERTKPTAPSQE